MYCSDCGGALQGGQWRLEDNRTDCGVGVWSRGVDRVCCSDGSVATGLVRGQWRSEDNGIVLEEGACGFGY